MRGLQLLCKDYWGKTYKVGKYQVCSYDVVKTFRRLMQKYVMLINPCYFKNNIYAPASFEILLKVC